MRKPPGAQESSTPQQSSRARRKKLKPADDAMETASWIEEAKHAMEELAAAEELSKWMRCQRSRRRQQRTNELVTAPGTPRTISQAFQQGRGPGSAPLSPHSKFKQVAWMEPLGAGTVGAVTER